eukprot:CAMPEP_0169199006 /NCGR_PEP_ID=MMETSP1016-20121227/9116_1 /TAXON_ID=342587 /ORGANISM="Karlodinium micrum, Strain CCMP2283" /LENGTH=350 /DNA_ID=CAMNT_0009275781 /DNA_START=81 /DNA_END=1133 /DNA_ORIENTATION=-
MIGERGSNGADELKGNPRISRSRASRSRDSRSRASRSRASRSRASRSRVASSLLKWVCGIKSKRWLVSRNRPDSKEDADADACARALPAFMTAVQTGHWEQCERIRRVFHFEHLRWWCAHYSARAKHMAHHGLYNKIGKRARRIPLQPCSDKTRKFHSCEQVRRLRARKPEALPVAVATSPEGPDEEDDEEAAPGGGAVCVLLFGTLELVAEPGGPEGECRGHACARERQQLRHAKRAQSTARLLSQKMHKLLAGGSRSSVESDSLRTVSLLCGLLSAASVVLSAASADDARTGCRMHRRPYRLCVDVQHLAHASSVQFSARWLGQKVQIACACISTPALDNTSSQRLSK